MTERDKPNRRAAKHERRSYIDRRGRHDTRIAPHANPEPPTIPRHALGPKAPCPACGVPGGHKADCSIRQRPTGYADFLKRQEARRADDVEFAPADDFEPDIDQIIEDDMIEAQIEAAEDIELEEYAIQQAFDADIAAGDTVPDLGVRDWSPGDADKPKPDLHSVGYERPVKVLDVDARERILKAEAQRIQKAREAEEFAKHPELSMAARMNRAPQADSFDALNALQAGKNARALRILVQVRLGRLQRYINELDVLLGDPRWN